MVVLDIESDSLTMEALKSGTTRIINQDIFLDIGQEADKEMTSIEQELMVSAHE